MYTIYMDGVPIYVPGADSRYSVLNPVLDLELNTSGTLTFSMPACNAEYDTIRKLKSTICVKRNGTEIWRGRPITTDRDWYNNKDVTCEGALSFLNDVVIRPFVYRGTLVGYITEMLNRYNTHVDEDRRIYVGNVTVVDSNDYVYKWRDTYNNLYDLFQDQLIDSMGGYLSIRTVNDVMYLDYTAESGRVTNQTVAYASNMIDLTETVNAEDVFTVIIPVGATITEDIPEDAPEGYEPEQYQIDITSVNDGKDYIESADGIELYGRIERVVEWPDVETPTALYTKARDRLESAINASVSISVDAVDLHWTDTDIDEINIGDYVVCLSVPHNIHGRFALSALRIKLDNTGSESYTFGAVPGTLTGIIANANNAAETTADTIVAYRRTNKDVIDVETADNRVGYACVGIARVG